MAFAQLKSLPPANSKITMTKSTTTPSSDVGRRVQGGGAAAAAAGDDGAVACVDAAAPSATEPIFNRHVTEWERSDTPTFSRPGSSAATIGIDEFVGLIKKDDEANNAGEEKDQDTGEPSANDELDALRVSASHESSKVRELMRASRDDASRNRASAITQIQHSIRLIEESGDSIPSEEKETLLAELTSSLQDLWDQDIVKCRRGSVIPVYTAEKEVH